MLVKLNLLLKFIGKKASIWLCIGFLSSIVLGFVDLSISLFIQLFLVNLGFINENIEIYGFNIPKLSSEFIISILLLIGIIRYIGQNLAINSISFVLDYINCRLRNLVIHDMLFKISKNINSASEVNFKISELFPKSSSFISSCVSFLSSFLQCFCVLIFMFFASWKESIVAFFGIFLIGILIIKINNWIRKIAADVPIEQHKLITGIEKVSRNLLFISVMRTQLKEQKTLVQSAINYASFSIRTGFLNNVSITLPPFLGIILLILILILSQFFWKTPGLVILSFLYLLIRFIQNLSSLVGLFGQLNLYYPQYKATLKYFHDYPIYDREVALKHVNNLKFYGDKSRYELFNSITRNQLTSKINRTEVHLTQQSLPPSILFDKVSFCYSPNQKNVIHNLNFFVKPGSQIGIIGPSGSGKSTILMLLLNILIPQKGEIKIDHSPAHNFFKNPDNLIGYVGPEPFLIKGTLRENVIYGIQREVIDEEILESCEKANLKELILEKGFDYEISEDHAGLSAGQKQRLCLARAILNNPKLLVLDEATANLDEATESSIAESIYKFKGNCTVVIVSHRPGILKGVDNVIKLV